MTRTKKEIIEHINRLNGFDNTDELMLVPKYKLCAMLQDLKDTKGHSSDSDTDLASIIGVRVK